MSTEDTSHNEQGVTDLIKVSTLVVRIECDHLGRRRAPMVHVCDLYEVNGSDGYCFPAGGDRGRVYRGSEQISYLVPSTAFAARQGRLGSWSIRCGMCGIDATFRVARMARLVDGLRHLLSGGDPVTLQLLQLQRALTV